jgi:hypothetical protein
MKLYTEEQLLEAMFRSGELKGDTRGCSYAFSIDEVLAGLTPIELPSDEEIEQIASDKINLSNDCFGQYDFTSGKQDGFYEGALWMRDKIQGGNK